MRELKKKKNHHVLSAYLIDFINKNGPLRTFLICVSGY